MEKEKITNEDVINEFREISNHSNKGLIIIIIILLLLLGATSYIIFNNKDLIFNKQEPIPTNKPIVVEETKKTEIEKTGHTIETTIGKFIVDNDGSVYYIDSEKILFNDVEYTLSESSLKLLNTKQNYINKTYQISPTCNKDEECYKINAYKLDLSNISTAYDVTFGNDKMSESIIFLSYDGNIYELLIEPDNNKKIQIILYKDITEYKQIVSVVNNISISGHNTILIDVNGKKYTYNGAKNITK